MLGLRANDGESNGKEDAMATWGVYIAAERFGF